MAKHTGIRLMFPPVIPAAPEFRPFIYESHDDIPYFFDREKYFNWEGPSPTLDDLTYWGMSRDKYHWGL